MSVGLLNEMPCIFSPSCQKSQYYSIDLGHCVADNDSLVIIHRSMGSPALWMGTMVLVVQEGGKPSQRNVSKTCKNGSYYMMSLGKVLFVVFSGSQIMEYEDQRSVGLYNQIQKQRDSLMRHIGSQLDNLHDSTFLFRCRPGAVKEMVEQHNCSMRAQLEHILDLKLDVPCMWRTEAGQGKCQTQSWTYHRGYDPFFMGLRMKSLTTMQPFSYVMDDAILP